MKYIRLALSVFIALIVVGVLSIGGYYAFKYAFEIFARLGFQITALTVIASIVALLAALIIARSIRYSSGQKEKNQFHAEKAATYQFFLDLWLDLIRQGSGSEGEENNKLSDELQILDRLLVLYGSPSVIKAHNVLRRLGRGGGEGDPHLRSQLAKGLIEIRKDLGSKTLGFSGGELEQLLFTRLTSQETTPSST